MWLLELLMFCDSVSQQFFRIVRFHGLHQLCVSPQHLDFFGPYDLNIDLDVIENFLFSHSIVTYIMLLIKSRNVACAISTVYILLQINLSLYMAIFDQMRRCFASQSLSCHRKM